MGTSVAPRSTLPTPGAWIGQSSAFLGAADHYDAAHQALAVLLGLNGLRVSEACETNVEDLAVERCHRILRITGKGNKPATIRRETCRRPLGTPIRGRRRSTTGDRQNFDRRAAYVVVAFVAGGCPEINGVRWKS